MNTNVVNKSDIKSALNLNGVFGNIIAGLVMSLMGFNKINRLYAGSSQYTGKEFTGSILRSFNIKYDIDSASLDNIPLEGPCIFVSNHPFGGVDGIVLYDAISEKRSDLKVMTNFILSHIKNLTDSFLPVNPFSNKGMKNSLAGIRAAVEHVESGHCLAIFPAGEVATYYGRNVIEDLDWQSSVIKLIAKAKVPVVPVYFHGTNSWFFHLIGKIHPVFRTIRLPRELLNKRGKTITVSIGKTIPVSDIEMYDSTISLGKYLRSRCYALEANLPQSQTHLSDNGQKLVKPIATPQSIGPILQELKSQPESLLFETSSFQCYLLDSDMIPMLMFELGRKREEAFRAVGEGTNKEVDIDDFDKYYKHLILWDYTNYCIAGAYRLGIGSEIIPDRGLEGFYTNTLFKLNPKFSDTLQHTIELGRSFVSVEYQRDALPLMLLIKGLLVSVMRYSECRFLMGPVSISSWIPHFYQSLIHHFLNSKHSFNRVDDFAAARSPFTSNFLRVDPQALLGKKMDTVEIFDRYLLRLSNNTYRLPTLVKKYIKLNTKIISFNIDKEFNYCLDAFIILDLKDVPESEIQLLVRDTSEEDQANIIKQFRERGRIRCLPRDDI